MENLASKEWKEKEEKAEDNLKKLLGDLFRFDMEDLDFGIYRIMNIKRNEIRKFIEEDLIGEVEEEFKELYEKDREDLEKKIGDIRKKIKEKLGEYAIDEQGNLNPLFENLFKKDEGLRELEREYKEKMEALNNMENAVMDKIEIFSRLYEFFSRYYHAGDLIPIRRYGRDNDYIVPYNGEEVYLYWANKDQYYVKTTEYFQKYTFTAGIYEINFKLREAHIDKNNVKGKDKYFVLCDGDFLEVDDRNVNIYFEYRELTKDDYGRLELKDNARGDTIKKKLFEDTLKRINEELDRKNHPDIKKQLNKKYVKKSGEESEKTKLEVHLLNYVTKNTKDYFIHKNLKKFFMTELDFYIKNEMMPLEDLTAMDEDVRKIMRRVKVFKNLATKIIEFLAEIEEFEKMLWEKKKFVLRTEYVITLDKIAEYAGEEYLESIQDEILANEKQIAEWKELFDIEVNKKEDLIEKMNFDGTKVWKKLPVDTKYFDDEFKWKLVVALTKENDLDKILDGILIKSENWQALNLLLNKYSGKVQTIYIDPPFNTGKDFLFKDNYQDSTWLTLMFNRLTLGKSLLDKSGSIYLHLDHIAEHYGKLLLDSIYGEENFRAKITWNTGENISGFKSQAMNWIRQADFIHFYSKSSNFKFIKIYESMEEHNYGWLDFLGYDNDKEKIFVELWENGELIKKKVSYKVKPKGTIWNDIYSFQYSEPRITESIGFVSNQKPENLLRRIIQSSSEANDLVLDFFLGSGTTTAVAQKLKRKWIGVDMGEFFNETYEDIIEVKNSQLHMINDKAIISIISKNDKNTTMKIKKLGILGRMKIVLFGDKKFYAIHSKQERHPHLSNDINWQGGGFFKYHTLEQYEDTLNNIEFVNEKGRQARLSRFQDYIFHMLEYGTRGSVSRLNIDKFKKPFSYKMRILENGVEKDVNVDLVETFNYLLGLYIKRIFVDHANGKKYVWVVGKRNGSTVVVVWRDVEDLDLKKDKDYIESNIQSIAGSEPDSIYVNGDNHVEGATPIEVEFMKLIGA